MPINNNDKTKKVTLRSEADIDRLLMHRESERNTSDAHVNILVNDIKKVGWRNGAKIVVVKETGELLDGQHRLLALRKIGGYPYQIEVLMIDEAEVTPELRAAFNKARSGRLPEVMKMCYGWENYTGRTAILRKVAKMFGGVTAVDESTMLNVRASLPEGFEPLLDTKHKAGMTSAIGAVILAEGIKHGDCEKAKTISNTIAERIMPTATCLMHRIDDLTSASSRLHESSMHTLKRIAYGIDCEMSGQKVPVLANVDDSKLDSVWGTLISACRANLRFE